MSVELGQREPQALALGWSERRCERGEHEVRRVDALLRGVVQLQGDPSALRLERERLGAFALRVEPPDERRRLSQCDDDEDRDQQVRGEALETRR